MKQTENYHLTQWEKSDRIQMEDFNRNNRKIDEVLHENVQILAAQAAELAANTAAVARCGNCKLIYGEYVGTGTFGKESPITLTFPGRPGLVFIQSKERYSTSCDRMMLLPGTNWAFSFSNINGGCPVTWGENSVSWYGLQSALLQNNVENVTYVYAAFLLMD